MCRRRRPSVEVASAQFRILARESELADQPIEVDFHTVVEGKGRSCATGTTGCTPGRVEPLVDSGGDDTWHGYRHLSRTVRSSEEWDSGPTQAGSHPELDGVDDTGVRQRQRCGGERWHGLELSSWRIRTGRSKSSVARRTAADRSEGEVLHAIQHDAGKVPGEDWLLAPVRWSRCSRMRSSTRPDSRYRRRRTLERIHTRTDTCSPVVGTLDGLGTWLWRTPASSVVRLGRGQCAKRIRERRWIPEEAIRITHPQTVWPVN